MKTKEIKIENKFPNHQYCEVVKTRNNITVVFFKVHKTDNEYRFFVNDNEELDRRLIERCKTLTINEKRIKHAIAGIWKHIDFLVANPNWKPAQPIEWVDKYRYICPNCGKTNDLDDVYRPYEGKTLNYDITYCCPHCKDSKHIKQLDQETYVYFDEDAYEVVCRDLRVKEKRENKETELEHRANNYEE